MPLTGREYIVLKNWLAQMPEMVNLAEKKWGSTPVKNVAEFLPNGSINGTIKHISLGKYEIYKIIIGE